MKDELQVSNEKLKLVEEERDSLKECIKKLEHNKMVE